VGLAGFLDGSPRAAARWRGRMQRYSAVADIRPCRCDVHRGSSIVKRSGGAAAAAVTGG
jgi:hypothetical protein